MNETIKRALVENAIEEVSYTESLELREGYSGRSMYGRETWGVVGSWTGVIMFAGVLGVFLEQEIGEEDAAVEVIADILRNVRTDNMGHDFIAYFPGVELVD